MRFVPVLLALLMVPCLSFADDIEDRPTAQVTASGTVTREPEQARLLLAVETFDKTARGAGQQNAVKMNTVLRALKADELPVAQVQTVRYSLVPEFEHDRGRSKPKPVGYTARNMIQATVDSIDRVGEVIDAVTEAGVNRVASLTFHLRDPEAAHLEALEAAMASAKARAKALARASGTLLGLPLRIVTGEGHRPPEAMRVQSFRAAGDTPIEGGTIQITARVTVHYELKR
jgi:hypothetical protein